MKSPRPFVLGFLVMGCVPALFISFLVRAQSPRQDSDLSQSSVAAPERTAFEVASIKPNRSADYRSSVVVGRNSGTFSMKNTTASWVIETAYNVQRNRLSGGPKWVDAEKFDIEAKIEDAEVEKLNKLPSDQFLDQLRLMVQSLLLSRFKLILGHETKELPVYVLVVAKNGSRIGATTQSGSKSPMMRMAGPGHLTATAVPMSALTDNLSTQPEIEGRVVLDETGLRGSYDIDLQWAPGIPASATVSPTGDQTVAGAPVPDSAAPSLFTALQEQLGLRLESAKRPVDVLVIDHIEEPSPN